MKICSKCGISLKESDQFCFKCGNNNFVSNINQNTNINNCGLRCPRCGSNNVNYQIVTHTALKKQGRGCAYWLFLGWWLEIILWLFLTLPRFLILIFGHKKQKIVNYDQKMAVCQNCGNSWRTYK